MRRARYERKGASAPGCLGVKRTNLFDRCTPKDGIVPFDALVDQVMSIEPYSKAQRVFVIVDNAARTPRPALDRPSSRHMAEPDAPPHPKNASWLNPAEIYFSIVERKVLTPNDFRDLDTLEQQAFEWKFTCTGLGRLAQRLDLPPAKAA